MKTLGDFKIYYQTQLALKINPLIIDIKKNEPANKLYIILFCVAAVVLLTMHVLTAGGKEILPHNGISEPGMTKYLGFFIILCFLGIGRMGWKKYKIKFLKQHFFNNYKEKYVRAIIKWFEPEWKYVVRSNVGRHLSDESDLLLYTDLFAWGFAEEKLEYLNAITGTIAKTSFIFFELENTVKDDQGRISKDYHLFFSAELNASIKGITYVFPEIKIPHNVTGELVKLENIEFEKRYCVYSTDQVEARYILTPEIMDNMAYLNDYLGDLYKSNIRFSFKNNRMYIMTLRSFDIFSENNFDENEPIKSMYKMVEVLNGFEIIITKMKLSK